MTLLTQNCSFFHKQPPKENPAFKTSILQQPDRARMSGMGDNVSRRMLDPPLVLQVEILPPSPVSLSVPTVLNSFPSIPSTIPPPPATTTDINSALTAASTLTGRDFEYSDSAVSLPSLPRRDPPAVSAYSDFQLQNFSSLIICSVTLLHHTINTFQSYADIPPKRPLLSRYVSVLLGQTTRNATYLDMQDGSRKHLFVFDDLSVRIQGRFRLFCTLTHILSGQTETLHTGVFEVYSPQFYPGILEPTSLSKWLYTQGFSVRSGFYSKSKQRPQPNSPPASSTVITPSTNLIPSPTFPVALGVPELSAIEVPVDKSSSFKRRRTKTTLSSATTCSDIELAQ